MRRGIPPRPGHIAPFRDTEQRAMHAGPADPDSARSAQAFRLAGRRGGCAARCASLPAAQPDRPERRRQDDVLQHAHRTAARGCRPDRIRRPRHRAPAGASPHSPRPRPFVPDPQRVPQPDDVRERACRRAGAQPASRTACGATPTRSRRSTPAHGRCWPLWDWRIARPSPAPICRMASSGCWRSRSRWRRTRNCCCSTNRWRVWRKPIARWSAR